MLATPNLILFDMTVYMEEIRGDHIDLLWRTILKIVFKQETRSLFAFFLVINLTKGSCLLKWQSVRVDMTEHLAHKEKQDIFFTKFLSQMPLKIDSADFMMDETVQLDIITEQRSKKENSQQKKCTALASL